MQDKSKKKTGELGGEEVGVSNALQVAGELEKRFSGSWNEEVMDVGGGTGVLDGSKSGRDKVAGSDDRKRCLTSRRHGGNIALIPEKNKTKRPNDLW